MAEPWKVPPQAPPNFNWTPESMIAETQSIIDNTRKLQKTLIASMAYQEPTFNNLILPLAEHDNQTIGLKRLFKFLGTVSPSAALRDASNASEKLFSEYEAQVLMEDEFFQSVDKVFRKQENIDSESRLYLEFKRQDFIKNGLAIKTESKRNRFVEVKRDIQDKEIEYRKSLNTDSGIWLSREELDGLPRHVLDGLGADEHSGNLWFPFKKPHLSLGLKFATRESTRRRIYVGNDNRCLDNVVRLKEILLLRDEAARLLGYQNHAELKIEGKMVESTDFINDFIGDLREKLTPLAKLELEALLSLKRDYVQDNEPADQHKVELNNSITATGDTKFHVWDFGFYDNLAIIKNHSFDEKTFSEYFSLQTTLAVMLSTYARLFSVQFHKIEKSQYREFASDHVMTWHEDVLIYTVGNDDEGSDFLGYLYLDLFPRDKKYNHAGHIAFQSGYVKPSGERHYPSSAVVMNLPKPQADKPTLLAHNDIRSLFHELGHAMHSLSSRTKYAIFHGTAKPGVTRDFVEIPSIMLENWWWTPSVIKELGHHYSYLSGTFRQHWRDSQPDRGAYITQPPETLDDEIIKNLLNSRYSSEALDVLHQCRIAIFDMMVHSSSTHEELIALNLSELWNKLIVKVSLMSGLEESEGWEWGHGCSRFGLIARGYDAGYFAYPLGKAYAQDVFQSMFEGDPMNREMGMKFRKTVLEPGGTRNGMDLLTDFLGRTPNTDAMYQHLGLHS